MKSVSPLERLWLLPPIYILTLISLPHTLELPNRGVLGSLQLTFLAISPGAALLYCCFLCSQTHREARWSSIAFLPVRGRWLCYLVTTLLVVPAGICMIIGLIATAGFWQAQLLG